MKRLVAKRRAKRRAQQMIAWKRHWAGSHGYWIYLGTCAARAAYRPLVPTEPDPEMQRRANKYREFLAEMGVPVKGSGEEE